MAEAHQWNEENVKELRGLWAEGLSITEIGKRMGISRNAVVGKVHRLGLSKRQSPIANKGGAKGGSKSGGSRGGGAKGGGAKGASGSKKAKASSPKLAEDLPLKLALRRINWSRTKCSWPIGDPKTTAFKFCGAEVVPSKPYCNEHCFEAYTTSREQGGG